MSTLLRKDKDGQPYGDNIYWDVESRVFVWRERIKGENRWRSTGTDKIGLARQRVKDFRAEASGSVVRQRQRHKVGEAFDLALKIKSAKGAKTYISAKTQIEGHLRPWFQEHCEYLDTWERDYEERWASYINDQAEKTPGRKLQHDREILLFALKRAREKGWITKEFAKTTRHGKFGLALNESTESIGRALDDVEVVQLLRAARPNETLYLQVRMAVLMGMRLREILHVQWSEFDWKTDEIVVKGARVKTRKGRRVPIHSSLVAELKALRKASQGDFVFPARHTSMPGAPTDWRKPQDDNSKAFGTAKASAARAQAKVDRPGISDEELERVEPVDCRFHDLRHTFMTNAMAEGMQPADVSKITGASLKVVMAIYHHIRGDVRERARNLFCGKFVGLS